MNVRKFSAANSREALRMVRMELGADAVILSNRKVGNGIEIVAAPRVEIELMEGVDEAPVAMSQAQTFAARAATNDGSRPRPAMADAQKAAMQAQAEQIIQWTGASRLPQRAAAQPAPVAPAAPVVDNSAFVKGQQGILSEIQSMRDMLQDQLSVLAWSDVQQRDPKKSDILRTLLNAGFSPALLRLMLDKIPADGDLSWVSHVLKNNIRIVRQEEGVIARGGVYALVGPTGVGKTTTTAKLAARAVVRYGADRVALITTDSYRIGAFEQLKTYGKILGVATHTVRDTDDLRRTLAGLKNKHLVLIDTMGMGQRDSRVATQTEMLNACGVQRLLLLNATCSGDTLDDVVRMYGGAGTQGCILTKLDEAVKLGMALDVVVRHRLPVHYIANGQRVPEDLHEVNLKYLLHRTLKPSKKTSSFDVNEREFPALMAAGKVKKAQVAHAF